MDTKTAPNCPVAACVVFPEMTVLPDDPIIGGRLSSETKRGDWTGELVLQPCGHTLTADQQADWLAAYEGGA